MLEFELFPLRVVLSLSLVDCLANNAKYHNRNENDFYDRIERPSHARSRVGRLRSKNAVS